jgi:hypothetical protein
VLQIRINPQGSVWVRLRSILPVARITMAAKVRKPKVLRANGSLNAGTSTAVRSLINMTVTAVTPGSVLLCLFAAKRLL